MKPIYKRVRQWLFAFLALLSAAPSLAQESITYSYDARGRLVTVDHGSTGPNVCANANYSYDPADNRSQVVVSTGAATLALSPASLPNGTVGVSYTQTVHACGGTGAGYTYSLSSGTLPAGLSLNSAGIVSGTPSTASTYNFTVKAMDSGGNSASRSYTIITGAATLSLSPTSLPSGTFGTPYSQQISASGGSGTGFSYGISAGSLPSGVTLASSTGALSGNPTANGTSAFTVRATDSYGNVGSQAYSLTMNPITTLVLSPASLPDGTWGIAYSQQIRASGGTGAGYSYSVLGGALPAGLSLSSPGVISGTPSLRTSSTFTVSVTDSAGNRGTRSYTLTIDSALITISPSSLPNAVAGVIYPQQNFSASGGTGSYGYSHSGSVPPGMFISDSPPWISYPPNTAGTYTFTISAADSAYNTGNRAYALTVNLGLTPASLPGGTAGTAYSQQVTAAGGSGSYSFSGSGFPPGLGLSNAGLLSGTPTTAGTYSLTVNASDTAGHTGSKSYAVTVGAGGSCGGVSFSVSAVSSNEGTPLVFTITKTGSTSTTCSLNYATQDGTAIAGNDYTATSGTLSFSSAQSSQTVSVTTFDNGNYDFPNLKMYLNLSSPSAGATLANTQATGTLKEADPNPCPTC